MKHDTDKVTHQIKSEQVKVNDVMAFVYYTKVIDSTLKGLLVRNVDSDVEFRVEGKELIERSFSADQYHETIKVSKTRAAEILVSSYNVPLTVCFEKQDGEERVLRGRLVRPEPLLGRSMVEDLDIADSHRQRLVDHRTIRYLIVEGVKYEVK